jgi:hypothetical protein
MFAQTALTCCDGERALLLTLLTPEGLLCELVGYRCAYIVCLWC